MSTSSRYFRNEKTPSRRVPNAHEELLASLNRINTYNPPVQTCSTGWKFHGLYYGPTSIAYLFFRLSSHYPDLVFKGQSLLDWSQAYLDLGAHEQHDSVDPSHCGIANERLTQLAIRAAMEKDPSLAKELCSYEKVINGSSGGSNEWLYGRSGYLYLLRLARSGYEGDSKATAAIDRVIQKTADRILSAKQPWVWHGKCYVGAAHGIFGIVGQLVLSSASSAEALQTILKQLLDMQFPSGNFPSSLPPGSDRLVQFCHGGPGAVLTLRSLRPYFPELQQRIDSAIVAAQKDIWKRGVLTKQPCLCHGIAGNALALDDEAEFQHFLAYMVSDVLEKQGWLEEAGRDDQLAGLYTGEAGRAWVWAVADKGLEKTCLGYNDI
ncbi:hypothetical protein KCU88_g3768, partial [Aureobasidium melanogenum]